MTCHDAREQFSALVDDALAADGRAAVDAHLATCADCRRELQRFRDTVSLVRAVAPVRAPAGFVDRVLEAARPVSWPRRLVRGLFLPWPVKLPMEAAAIVLVAVGVALVYRGTPELELATRLEQPVPVVAQAPESQAPVGRAPLPPLPTSPERKVDALRDQAPAKDQAQALAKTEGGQGGAGAAEGDGARRARARQGSAARGALARCRRSPGGGSSGEAGDATGGRRAALDDERERPSSARTRRAR